MSRPFRVLTAVVLALLVLGALTAATEVLVLSPRLERAWQTVRALDASEQAMVDQETGVRGFLLAPPTTDRQFLEPYTRGTAQHGRAAARLRALEPTGELARALAVRQTAALAWQVEWADAAVGDAAGKPTSELFLDQGKSLFDAYRSADASAGALLGERLANLLRWQRDGAIAVGVAGLCAALGALVAVSRTRRRLLHAVATPLAGVAAVVRAGPGAQLAGTSSSTDIRELHQLEQDVTSLFSTLRERDEELRAHARELEALGAASRALLTDPDPRNAICRAAVAISGATHTYLFEPHGAGSLVDTAGVGDVPGQVVLPLHGEQSLTAQVFLSRQTVLVEDVHDDPRIAQRVVEGRPRVGGIWLPVLSEDRCLGVLVVGLPQTASRVPASVPASLAVLAGAAASAIDRVDLHDRLAQQARSDGLTGVANRRAWDEQLPTELVRAGRAGWPLAVAMLDLDHFKAYNDTRGHQAGDQLLRTAAHRWHDRLRGSDLLARYGGEEFAVALPDCDLPAAVALLDGLRGQLPDGQTCSVGVALWDRTETAIELLARADRALYEAKAGGRDHVRADLPPTGAPRADVGRLIGSGAQPTAG